MCCTSFLLCFGNWSNGTVNAWIEVRYHKREQLRNVISLIFYGTSIDVPSVSKILIIKYLGRYIRPKTVFTNPSECQFGVLFLLIDLNADLDVFTTFLDFFSFTIIEFILDIQRKSWKLKGFFFQKINRIWDKKWNSRTLPY